MLVVESADPTDAATDRLAEEFPRLVRLTAPVAPERLATLLGEHQPRLLLLKPPLDSVEEELVAACAAHGVRVLLLARPTYGLLQPTRVRRLGGLPWIELRRGGDRRGKASAKRCLDIVLVLLAAPMLLPLMALVALAVCLDGSPFYVQERVGARGRPFRMVKFRTLRVDAELGTGPTLVAPGDVRVTRLGRWLRRTRLDELPQLWNVLRGEMSLVGPRPERPEFTAGLARLPHYHRRHLLRPGLTGIAQLTGGYGATAEEKLRCDLFYLNCRSLRLDLALIALTVVELVRGFPRG